MNAKVREVFRLSDYIVGGISSIGLLKTMWCWEYKVRFIWHGSIYDRVFFMVY